jgi:DNA polymerase-3 subunit alpha
LSRLNHVESILGREVTVAGIVTDAQHRISKMGKGWGIFRLEDFHGDYEFKLFGEDYLKFRHFFDNEQLLYIKARGRKFNQRQGEGFVERLSVDVAEVRLLSEVLEESSKSLEIKLNLQWLTTPLVDELHELLSLHPGKKRVKLHVIDAEEKLDIKLPVKEFKVTIAKDLLQVLEQHEHLQPKVIS